MMKIFGIDIGKVSFKAVMLGTKEFFWKVHQQKIEEVWQELKSKWQISDQDIVVTTGRHRKVLSFPKVVDMVCQKEAARFLYPNQDVTIIRLGGGGFSVLNIKASGQSKFWQNPRCAAGTGSFLEQILGRLGLTNIIQADQMAKDAQALEITLRCGVTMKTDATHLANEGAPKERIIAGLFDALAKNAVALTQRGEISSPVLIIGGLSVSERIVRTIQEKLGKEVKVKVPKEALYFEALGAALIGKRVVEEGFSLPENKIEESPLVFLPGLKNFQHLVTRMQPKKYERPCLSDPLIIGLDIGSTGSKLVIFNPTTNAPIFEQYVETRGQPIEAAKELLKKIPQEFLGQIRAIGCTGSGRYTVAGPLMASLAQEENWRIFIHNEIVAHATGSHFYDPDVDTIVDIGGQDAKYIRLETGRMIDFQMNTVCSAGTGSFLAEQVELLGIKDVVELGKIALESPRAVYLGQHCAVFIAEQIDEARRKGAELPEIVAGLYDSIIENYDKRVKGFREWGKKIYLQGKPAENEVLALALAGVTGKSIIVPPSPGIPGALGIALWAKQELAKIDKNFARATPLDFRPFLESEILKIEEHPCQSKVGCRVGNQCPIKTITVKIGDKVITDRRGGRCDLYEKRPGKNPELAKGPHTFRERENLILEMINKKPVPGLKKIAIPRGLETEEISALFITFFQQLGFAVEFQESRLISPKTLEQGSKLCQATFCAPLQLLAGQAELQKDADYIFLPKIIEIAGVSQESVGNRCYVCPLSQAMPDMFSPKLTAKILQPFLNFKKGYKENWQEFRKIGDELGCSLEEISSAFSKAVQAQKEFEHNCCQIGERGLEFAREKQIPAIVVLGHPYIISSALLTAGIPQTIEENGAIAIPANCYPLNGQNALPKNIYWGYGQRLLQAAYQIRRQAGVYPLWLSVYSCGPDSFLLHFFQYLSQGKPYTILESDAYTGQAGFKTRVEAFLSGVKNYQPKEKEVLTDLKHFEKEETFAQIKASGRKILVPWMGESSRILSALFRSLGVKSQALPLGDPESLKFGRKYTTGKECQPMIDTLGCLFKHLTTHPDEKFYYFMPQSGGPCRFGQYQLLFKIILEKLGLADRVGVISPSSETGYQYQLEVGKAAIAKGWAGLVFTDLLKDALFNIRPEEKEIGLTQQIFDTYFQKAEEIIEQIANNWSGLGSLWGLKPLAKKAAQAFGKIARESKKGAKPFVLVTGEIYVRLNDFSNSFVIQEMENFGCRVKLAPFREWANYITELQWRRETLFPVNYWKIWLKRSSQRAIEKQLYQIFAKTLGWSEDHHIEEILETARPYLSGLKPLGEAALTIGLPLLLWQKKEIDGVVIVGPFECMPSRIAESQLNLISQQTGLPVLNLSFYGEPLDRDILESFIWDLRK